MYYCHTALTLPLLWRRSTASSVFRVGARGRAINSLSLSPPSPLPPSLISNLASVDVTQNVNGPRFDSVLALVSLKKLRVICGHCLWGLCPSQLMILCPSQVMILCLSQLMKCYNGSYRCPSQLLQESLWWRQCSVRHSLPLSQPTGISVPARGDKCGDCSVVRASDSWSKGRGFESQQERRENVLL